jgi:hypothetical protein
MVDSISKQEKAPVWALLFYAGFAARFIGRLGCFRSKNTLRQHFIHKL